MRIKVYVIEKDDGNVCCGGTEVERVFLSRGRAQRYCDEMNAKAAAYPYNEYHRSFTEYEAT